MIEWPVLVQDWQQECCGRPFSVGDRVSWTLVVMSDAAETWLPTDAVTSISLTSTRDVAGKDPLSVVRTGDGVVAAYGERVSVGERVVVRGAFMEEHHGGVPDDLPPTHAVVRRIRLLRQLFRNVRGREWAPVAGAIDARDIDTAPVHFAGFGDEPQAPQHLETGVLVDIAVVPDSGDAAG
jgi:hypothetical protein